MLCLLFTSYSLSEKISESTSTQFSLTNSGELRRLSKIWRVFTSRRFIFSLCSHLNQVWFIGENLSRPPKFVKPAPCNELLFQLKNYFHTRTCYFLQNILFPFNYFCMPRFIKKLSMNQIWEEMNLFPFIFFRKMWEFFPRENAPAAIEWDAFYILDVMEPNCSVHAFLISEDDCWNCVI